MIGLKSILISSAAALLLVVISTPPPLPAQSANVAAEETAPIQKAATAVVMGFINAWNAHDANSLGRLFTEDGDFVGIGGTLWHSPAEITRVHAELFAGRYDHSAYTLDGTPNVAFLGPELALIHWRWTISGVLNTDGTLMAPYSGIFTWVAVNRQGAWRVRAAQNTVIK
jgi:uncharacterized protein (TIGR02246 family)